MTRPDWPAPTTAAEEIELGTAIRAGGPDATAARNRLAAAHLGFAMARAERLAPRIGMDVDDAFGAAQLGLIRAAEKFDPATGCRFTTYARWWIDQAIGRHGAKAAGSAAAPICLVVDPGHNPERSAQAAAFRCSFLRLDEPMPNGQSRHEMVAAPVTECPDAEAAEAVREALARLPRRDREALSRFYGIGRPAEPTEATAAMLGCADRTLRTVRERAKARLRADVRLQAVAGRGSAC